MPIYILRAMGMGTLAEDGLYQAQGRTERVSKVRKFDSCHTRRVRKRRFSVLRAVAVSFFCFILQ